MRTCRICGEEKELTEFPKRKPSGYRNDCKECVKNNSRVYRSKKHIVSKQDVIEFVEDQLQKGTLTECRSCGQSKQADEFYTKRAYGKVGLSTTRCKECERWYQIERNFNITKGDYLDLLLQQSGDCAICGISLEAYRQQGYRDWFAVDHDHQTNEVRGLLCDQCNRGLGYFKDSPERLQKATNYLKGRAC
ncbi:MAG: hypothetical protein GY799_21365 [Desulfobulbaceae bacterium]|nr:hypothetical protein [Desulfobulbaceae bacterium]